VPPDYSREEALARVVPEDRDRRLVLAARSGDEDACREIYRTFREPVWSIVLSLVGDPLQAQDVLQNVFMKVFRGLPRFGFRSSLYTWIYRIACNESRSHFRKRSVPVVPLDEILGGPYEAADGGVPEDGPAGGDALRRAVRDLPSKLREVIVLKYQEDLSYEEMSRVLGCPPGTVASRLNRALAELGALVRRSGERP
jgi:RNA polymerase sigma-70 factor (ECF subfamily)